ncbi:tetratricopeptide repeat protein [Rickettsiales bacterium]|nr:tetratricopeptide repeat protein [Rickettsiales bacterium]
MRKYAKLVTTVLAASQATPTSPLEALAKKYDSHDSLTPDELKTFQEHYINIKRAGREVPSAVKLAVDNDDIDYFFDLEGPGDGRYWTDLTNKELLTYANPVDVSPLLSKRARELLEAGHDDEAMELFLADGRPSAIFDVLKILVKKENFSDFTLDKANIAITNGYIEAYELRGDIYSKRGNYQSALEDYKTALTVCSEKKDQLERKINKISEILGAETEKTCWTDYVNGDVAESCKAALSEDYSIAP